MSEPRALPDASDTSSDADDLLDDAPARSRNVVLLAGAGAVAVLALGGALLLGGGPDGTEVALATTPAAAPAPAGTAPATPTASPAASAPPAVTRPARDPFAPLAGSVGQSPAPAAGGTDPTSGSTTGGVPLAGDVPGTGTASGSTSGTTSGSGSGSVPVSAPVTAPVGSGTAGTPGSPPAGTGAGTVVPSGPGATAPVRRLALTRVGGTAEARTAVLTLDGVPVTVAVGAAFGTDLVLLSLQEGPEVRQWTAVVQRGKSQPFDVVSGPPVTVP